MDILSEINQWCEDFERPDQKIDHQLTLKLLREEVRETEIAVGFFNREEIVDGYADVAFIAINGIYKEFRRYGLDPETSMFRTKCVLNRVVRANNAKRHDGEVVFREDGKVMKPEGWLPPCHKDLF